MQVKRHRPERERWRLGIACRRGVYRWVHPRGNDSPSSPPSLCHTSHINVFLKRSISFLVSFSLLFGFPISFPKTIYKKPYISISLRVPYEYAFYEIHNTQHTSKMKFSSTIVALLAFVPSAIIAAPTKYWTAEDIKKAIANLSPDVIEKLTNGVCDLSSAKFPSGKDSRYLEDHMNWVLTHGLQIKQLFLRQTPV